ncbi:MAG: hypothetical protein MJA31_14315 [Clostridia bacterium]|nr:hypothetical protein [Clostridia bacterium]
MITKILETILGWKTISITSNIEEYARVRGRLIDNGIKSKTKIIGNGFKGRNPEGISMAAAIGTRNHNRENYEISVKKEDVHRAYQAIQQK